MNIRILLRIDIVPDLVRMEMDGLNGLTECIQNIPNLMAGLLSGVLAPLVELVELVVS